MVTDISDTAGSCTASDKVSLTGASSSPAAAAASRAETGPGSVTGLTPHTHVTPTMTRSKIRTLPRCPALHKPPRCLEILSRNTERPTLVTVCCGTGGGEATPHPRGARGKEGAKTRNISEDEHHGWASLCWSLQSPAARLQHSRWAHLRAVPELLCSVLGSLMRGFSHPSHPGGHRCARGHSSPTLLLQTTHPAQAPCLSQNKLFHTTVNNPAQSGYTCWPGKGLGCCSLLLESQNTCHGKQGLFKPSEGIYTLEQHQGIGHRSQRPWSVGWDSSRGTGRAQLHPENSEGTDS